MSANLGKDLGRLHSDIAALNLQVDITQQKVAILSAQLGELQQRLALIEARLETAIGPNQRRGSKPKAASRY